MGEMVKEESGYSKRLHGEDLVTSDCGAGVWVCMQF